ncbi:hypothetical protein MMC15_001598 [Xylographa vitiligo]|nr:hypothetical protein [Xylographa vitiligo]
MGVREGLIVAFVVGEGVNDAVLAKVVVFGKPVDNRIPLGADMPVDREIPLLGENVTLDIPVKKGMRELDGKEVVFGYPIGIPLEADEVVLGVPVEIGIMLEPVPEEVIFELNIDSGAVGPVELLRFPEEVGKVKLGGNEEVMIGSPLEPEDVALEIVLRLKGMLVSEDKGLELEIVPVKVELLVAIVEMEIGVLIVEIKEVEELLLSAGNEEVDIMGAVEDVLSPKVEKELG